MSAQAPSAGFARMRATMRNINPSKAAYRTVEADSDDDDDSETGSDVEEAGQFAEPKKTWVNITNKPEIVDGSVDGVDDETKMQTKIINEEYKIWKKNAVYLYDIMFA